MKHVKPIGMQRPALAQNDLFCRLAVILTAFGIDVPKELIQKCIGVNPD